MTEQPFNLRDICARLLCVWGLAWGCYGLSIPEPFVRLFGFTLAVICGAAVFLPRVIPPFLVWFSGLMGVLAMLIGLGVSGLPGLALTATLSVLVLGPPVLGALWLNQIHNPRPPKPGVCAKCGYSLAGLESNRCPECGESINGES